VGVEAGVEKAAGAAAVAAAQLVAVALVGRAELVEGELAMAGVLAEVGTGQVGGLEVAAAEWETRADSQW